MEEIDLKEFLKYLRKYIWMMLVAVVVFVGATAFYDCNIKTKLFKSTTTVVLNNGNSAKTAQEDLTTVNLNQKLVTTYSELVKNRTVLQRTIDRLVSKGELAEGELTYEELRSKISIKNVDDTEILMISVEDANAERATLLANRIAHDFENVVEEKFGQKNVKQFDQAVVPEAQSNDTTVRDIAIAAMVGIFGVTAIAFLIFYFDDTVKYSKNLEKELNAPIVGKIVRNTAANKKGSSELVVADMPKAGTSEAIRALRTNLSFSSIDKGLKSLLISSVNASEGKSFVSSNLAVAYAQAGYKVLLVDCDLRKGRLHRIFGLKNKDGFSNMLIDTRAKSYKKYIKDTDIENLWVITRGVCPPNPSEILGSNRANELVEALKEKYDIVLFDGAPCGGLSDSIVASKFADAVALVCMDGRTNRTDLLGVIEDLKRVEAPFAGVIMNNIKRSGSSYYNYYNYYEKEPSKKAKLLKRDLKDKAIAR
jgi:capsular exopolysaccharide synthesis family protein